MLPVSLRRAPRWMGLVVSALSGRGVEALRAQAERLCAYVGDRSELDPADVGLSLATKPAFESRAVVSGRSREQLLAGVQSLAQGERSADVLAGAPSPARGCGTVWVFPGQGSQWPGMAVDLLDSSPVFRRRLRECQDALAPFVDW